MDLAKRPINVHPPRARKWARPGRSFLRQARLTTGAAREALAGLDVAPPEIGSLSMFARMTLPGWPQFALKRKIRGALFAAGGAIGLVIGLLFFGTLTGTLGFGFLLSIHAASISDAFAPAEPRVARSIFTGFCSYCLLVVFLYGPAGWLITRFVQAQTLNTDVYPFVEGDVLLMRVGHHPARGDWVVYNARSMTFARSDRRQVTLREGPTIDRVVAVAGDTVAIEKNRLFVNGKSTAPGTAPADAPASPGTIVPPGSVFILPAQAIQRGVSINEAAGGAIVPVENIQGILFLQSHPLSHFHWLHREPL
jgi:hypothetical protein